MSNTKDAAGRMHSGHRQRLRERYEQEGLNSFQDHEILELLLYYAIPQRDTNELAHTILDYFGNDFSKVLEASPRILMKVPGVGFNTAVLISMLLPTYRAYQRSVMREKQVLDTFSKASEYLSRLYTGYDREVFILICLDPRSKIISTHELGTGSVTKVGVPYRTIAEEALRMGAASVIFSHNHPAGRAFPSSEDIQYTLKAASMLRSLEIELNDHIIVGNNPHGVISLRHENFLDTAFSIGIMPGQDRAPYDADK